MAAFIAQVFLVAIANLGVWVMVVEVGCFGRI